MDTQQIKVVLLMDMDADATTAIDQINEVLQQAGLSYQPQLMVDEEETYAGFSKDEINIRAIQQKFILNDEQLAQLCNYFVSKMDMSISVSAWDQMDTLIGMFAMDNKIEPDESVELVEEMEPENSDDYITNLGTTYYNLKTDEWTQGGDQVFPIWWKYPEDED